jgi:hypothetical protein
LTKVILLVVKGGVNCDLPIRPNSLDGRNISPASLVDQLRELVDKGRPAEIQVLVTPGNIRQLLRTSRAHPARPFAVTEIRDADIRPTHVPSCITNSNFRGTLPALFAWLAAMDGASNQPDKELRVQLVDSQVLAVDVLRGIVTRCELLPSIATSVIPQTAEGILDSSISGFAGR